MAMTNFNNLNTNQLTSWARQAWKVARNNSFVMQFAGTGSNSVVSRITELTKDQKGARAVVHLIPNLTGQGVTGDYGLNGNEEQATAYDMVVVPDQLRNAIRSSGRMADQKVVVKFRETARDLLGYWLADTVDQLAFLTLAGITSGGTGYRMNTDGSLRTLGSSDGLSLNQLAFAADVSTPTSTRYFRWDQGTQSLMSADVTAVVAADTPSYAMLVAAKAKAKTLYMRGVRGPGGQEFYHVFMHPQGVAKLKLDTDFKNAVLHAASRGMDNPIFAGSIPTVDGLIIHEHRHVFNTLGATAQASGANDGAVGYKWGLYGSTVCDGQAVLFCGAQALAMADLGDPYWDEHPEDYNNQAGIAVGKIFGLRKSKFNSVDYGVIRIDTAI